MPGYAAVISIQSRECSPELMQRLAGSALFPERPLGAAIVSVACRGGGFLLYVTAPTAVGADDQIEYYVNLLPEQYAGTVKPARDRVSIVGLEDTSARWLSTKLLDPEDRDAAALCEHIREFAVEHHRVGATVRLSYFEPSENLDRLARDLGVRGDQAAADVIPLGTKAAGRRLMADAGVPIAAGTPEVHSVAGLAAALAELFEAGHRRFALKLSSTEFGAGMGNARLDLSGLGATSPDAPALDATSRADLVRRIAAALPTAELVDPRLTWDQYAAMAPASGIMAEEWIDGTDLRSPSFQGHVGADGLVLAVSTHDQVLGSAFPADEEYRAQIIDHGLAVGRELADQGFRGGDYGVDFLTTRPSSRWQVLGCEVNLRATGTKHGFVMVTNLLNVSPDDDGGLWVDGTERFYQASDGIADPAFVGLQPLTVISAVRTSPLHYNSTTGTGVVLHLLSALLVHGKFGAVCIGRSRAEAEELMAQLKELVYGICADRVEVASAEGTVAAGWRGTLSQPD
jgi:PGM1 C-terminal domain